MHVDVAAELKIIEAQCGDPDRLRLAFAYACVERVRHLLEDSNVIGCLEVLAEYLDGRATRLQLESAAADAVALADRHQGSRSLDGVGHAAVSASYAVALALRGRAGGAADYAAYAIVYGGGGYGAVSDLDSFVPEKSWQVARLGELASALPKATGAA